MKRSYFNRLYKRFRRRSYTASNAILMGRKAIILVRVEYVIDLVKTMRIIGRICDYHINDANECYINVENCDYSYNINGKDVHESGLAHAKMMCVDIDTIKRMDYIFE